MSLLPNRLLLTLIFSIVFVSSVFAQGLSDSAVENESTSKIVKAIEVDGNKTISIATILSKIKTRVGQPYIQTVVSDDLKRLYNTGYFSDVSVDREPMDGGFKVIILLEEKPIVEEITFSKTRQIKSRSFLRKLKTKAGQFLDNKELQDDKQTIKDLYEKKGLTNVEVEVESFIDEVTNKASLHFVIREGQKVQIRRINIYGNDSYKDGKIMKVIKTRPKRWWWWGGGILKNEVLDEDMDRISAFYEQNGYIDAYAEYTTEHLYQGRIEINIEISEGKRYAVGRIDIEGNDIVSTREIERVMKNITVNGVFSRAKLSIDLSAIRTLYFNLGYIFAVVQESTNIDPATGLVSVVISIKEGSLAYVEKVKIQGNTRTRDIVIRRELKMYPGDRFDGAKLKRSKERLGNLGYFEDVSFDIEDTDTPDRKNLVVQVKEAKTGTFSFGGGFSTVDQIVGFIELDQRNFDITNWPTFTGGGQKLTLRAETGSTRNNFRLSFTEPWIFDYPVSGGFDLYRSERDKDDDTGFAYDEEKTGAGVRFGKEFTEYLTGRISYKIERVDIQNIDTTASAALRAEEGETDISVIGLSLVRDTRDSTINPTKGYTAGMYYDIAGGPLGADRDFMRVQLTGSYFIPFKWESVLELRARGGIVDEYDNSTNVPIFERFFVGGSQTIRGYDEREVGPQDAVTSDPIGGESIFVTTAEYTIPLVEFIKAAAFVDAGNVWADTSDFLTGEELKIGAGMGLRIRTPIGPINLDYGIPLSEVEGKDGKDGKFYFSVSRGF